LELLPKLTGLLVVPAAVVREVTVRKEEAELMAFLETAKQLQIQPDGELRPEVLAWDLGSGESQAISLAARLGAARVVLDDLEARRCANSLNIRVIGSLGVVVMAKQKGLIAEAKPVIERLRRVGLYLDDGLVAKALEMVSE
jgi:predicted nucleic acid-binding protein